MGICNFEDISYNLIGASGPPTQLEDSSMGIVQCKNDTNNFKSYAPYTGNIGSKINSGLNSLSSSVGQNVSISNKTITDASCCYIYTLSGETPDNTCSDFKFEISGVNISGALINIGNLTIDNSGAPNDGASINICSRSITQSAQSMGANIASVGNKLKGNISDIASKGKSMGGLNGFVLLVVSGLLSLLVYVLFMLGPFMFWTKFAPNTLIVGENDCNRGRTILDRHFSHDRNELPYNWQKYDVCRPPLKEKPIVLDKCMNDTNIGSLQDKIKVSGSDVFSKLDFLIRGFPYNLIDPQREKFYKCYVGGISLLTTIIFVTIIALLMINVSGNLSTGTFLTLDIPKLFENIAPLLLNAIVAGAGMYFILVVMMKKEQKDAGKSLLIGTSLTAVTCIIISMFGKYSSKLAIVMGSLLAIGLFLYIASLSNKRSVDGKNYGFSMAIVKALYYIRKSFVTGYRDSNIGAAKYFSYFAKFVGKLPIPGWIWTIFGPLLLPFVIIVAMFIIVVTAIIGGFFGFYDWVEPIITKDAKCYGTFKDYKKKKMSGGSSDDEGYSSDPGDNRISGGMPTRKEAIESSKANISELNKKTKANLSKGLNILKRNTVSIGKDIKSHLKKRAAGVEEGARAFGIQKEKGGFQSLGTGLLLLVIPIFMAFLYGVLVLIFSILRYFIVPLFYPKIMVNIISCNIKSLIFTFVMGFLGIMWHPDNQNKYVPKEALIWMTVTFSIITLFNILSK